jgi:hypothetical protein
MEKKPSIPQLDELAQTQPGALEAALEEMVNSGFGEMPSSPCAQPAPTPGPKVQAYWGWW